MNTQVELIQQSSSSVKARMVDFASAFPLHAFYVETEVGVGRSNPDAVQAFRLFLEATDVHTYKKQGRGGELFGHLIDCEYFEIDAGAVTATEVKINFYRSETTRRQHKRFNIRWKGIPAKVAIDDRIGFGINDQGGLVVVNLTTGFTGSVGKQHGQLSALLTAAKNSKRELIPQKHEVFHLPGSEELAPSSQAFVDDVKLRLAIERHAVRAAIDYYELRGGEVVERGAPFDLEVQLDGTEIHVEVKGSRKKSISKILITPNEADEANKYAPTHLVVVDRIVAKRDSGGEWRTSKGRIRIWEEWKVPNLSLEIVTLRHSIDPSTAVAFEKNL